jgi:hypothetical protein
LILESMFMGIDRHCIFHIQGHLLEYAKTGQNFVAWLLYTFLCYIKLQLMSKI